MKNALWQLSLALVVKAALTVFTFGIKVGEEMILDGCFVKDFKSSSWEVFVLFKMSEEDLSYSGHCGWEGE